MKVLLLLCWYPLPVMPNFSPSKSLSRMKLTTPATASAPYVDEAPPVRMSTRFTRKAGMKFRSGEIEPVSPPGMRRPSIRTRVRLAPR